MLLAIGLFASGWPEHIRAHPYWIGILFLLGAVLMGFGFFPGRTSSKDEGMQSNSAGPNNTGNQIIAHNSTIHLSSNGHLSEQKFPVQPEPVSVPRMPHVPRDLKLIIKLRWKPIYFDMVPGVWREAQSFDYERQPRMALLADLMRPFPAKGEGSIVPISVGAILKLTYGSGETDIVKHAYWIERTNYEMTFSAGHTEVLVVGCWEESSFASYICEYRQHGGHPIFDLPVREKGQRVAIPARGTIFVAIALFDEETAETLEEIQIAVEFDPNKIPIARIRQ
jgi:hypothetical protein